MNFKILILLLFFPFVAISNELEVSKMTNEEIIKERKGTMSKIKALSTTIYPLIFAGEFGRTPVVQGSNGRDHNPEGFTMWMAGGGVKGGYKYGATDEYGYYAQENKMHVNGLHATLLHAVGLDHTQLTYRYAGRDFRLTDVGGNVATDIFA